uniref:adenylate cyclase n=1 Tax=Stomoxys calcitrans TaxID=35570 RepID=A0A1I8PUZ5_STOCA
MVAWSTSLMMVFTDLLIGLIGYLINSDILRPCYCGYTISCIYLFLPLPEYSSLGILALCVSILYGINFTFVAFIKSLGNENNITVEWRYLVPDLLFLVALNVVGMCFRARRDYATRRVFLTRHLNIEEGLLLKYAKDQENNLLISIIPVQIAEKIGREIKARIERFKNPRIMRQQYATEFARKLFIEPHFDVSIIFADLVNYTHLTTTLDIKTLVETLHDLFQRFDVACEEFNVMRIKFLGDCYYGVTGVPQAHPFHAHCCIEFGRSIIEQIAEVRNLTNLKVDMRIGIHSGNILSGIIGAAKWQYDIWSKDVDVASHLEQTGIAGRVHISKTSLQYVEAYYVYESGTEKAKRDALLLRENITTYLIIRPSDFMTQSKEWENYRSSMKSKQSLKTNRYPLPHAMQDIDSNQEQELLDYDSIKSRANLQIARDLKKLPIYKLGIKAQLFTRMPRLKANEMEDFTANRNISTGCLLFSDWNWELRYNQQTDELFRISTTMAVFVLFCVMGMEGVNEIIHNLSSFLFVYIVTFIYAICILILIWFRQVWTKFSMIPVRRPRHKIASQLFDISTTIDKNATLRILTFISLILSILFIAFVHSMFCDPVALENDDDLMQEFLYGGRRTLCFNSWSVTESLVLCLAVIFTYSHIPYLIQMITGILITIYYLLIVFIEFDLVYECSLVTNKTIRAEASHLWNLLTILMIYQLMSRHLIYILKIEAISKWRLEKKKDNAQMTNESIKILLHNILPSHVVNIYLSKRMRNEPYYEQHEYVAVMFATIIYARSGSIELRLLNEIICELDEVLRYYKGPIKVEKIKVANWSYMAACGFDIPVGESAYHAMPVPRTSIFLPSKHIYPSTSSNESEVRTSSYHSSTQHSESDKDNALMADSGGPINDSNLHLSDDDFSTRELQKRHVLKTMANFALDLLSSIHTFNVANQMARGANEPAIKLRIGISSGEVMAGVVGSSQAYYDIWGNAVNMASRMDSTGEPGRIQVTEEAADALKSFNVACKYRGYIHVKGRGYMPTYFVRITKDFQFRMLETKNVEAHKYHQD